jgi:hypothetical protein
VEVGIHPGLEDGNASTDTSRRRAKRIALASNSELSLVSFFFDGSWPAS